MLSPEQNERLTRVGPGTPVGELMRRYWQPFLPEAMLRDNPVQKVRLLGEDLVCYKDRSGTYGLIGDHCAHRLVGMEYGIPDEHGLRCPYHGWCYDETGACVDTPLEPKTSRLKDNVHLKGYSVKEMGGLLFAYMGPDEPPLLPPFELFVWPNAIRQIGYTYLPCNWLQCHENASDPTHATFLHGAFFQWILERDGLMAERAPVPAEHMSFNFPKRVTGFSHIITELDEYGLQKACIYKQELGAKEDSVNWHSPTIFPHNVRVGGPGKIRQEYQIRVPIDDENTYHIAYEVYIAPDGVEIPEQDYVPCYEAPITDESGEPILDYVLAQDMLAWWSQGALTDRGLEHLGVTDSAIVQFRDLLDQQARLVEEGGDPMNTYRDPASMPEIIYQEPFIGRAWVNSATTANSRNYPHKGTNLEDDIDRYGPARDEVMELSRRVEAFLGDSWSATTVEHNDARPTKLSAG